jgi:hypothetical protein
LIPSPFARHLLQHNHSLSLWRSCPEQMCVPFSLEIMFRYSVHYFGYIMFHNHLKLQQ